MLLLVLNVLFVLIAISMIALILMQRGAGAQAGSGFGGGASSTVFGARGSSNFLSKATKWLAISFFALTLFMAWYATRQAQPVVQQQDLGVMSAIPQAPAAPAADASVPQAPAQQGDQAVPAAPPAQPAADAEIPAPAPQNEQ
ncbi:MULTISPECIES: preprotein translocase subunit SecG [unclassified Luteimonas]|uniref:preprotein translocase subunit SecG n=1 Tax=Lysobacteraceae TaxID=32033 RepID=UPI00100A5513|nr:MULTISPECIES: preprotein translocase subunit SecG [unclassified Luteimonas]MCD9046186.1 preprotein translocase subunit SecG [Luteimonas sp. MHLX1A]